MRKRKKIRKQEWEERSKVRKQTVRIEAFCQKIMETEEQPRERLKENNELTAVQSSETEQQGDAGVHTLSEPDPNLRILPKEKTKMSESTGPDRSDTEKVKRRMIRTIGRLLNEKKPEDELWEYMAKEYGKKCRILWDRMRLLTLKKLKILFDVDDVVNNVPKVARMTLTDWLIFDLVLVHEKFDVIDMRKVRSNNTSNALAKLFSLVQQFGIEGRVGEDLANAWITATVHYNAAGHQCSPMLLQRRWYQLKEVTRATFYKFWFIFRGTKRQLAKAKEESPVSAIQRDVALRYSHIITEPFKQWEECIKDRTVIMPEEFEMKMRSINLMQPSDLTVPDLVLLEPKMNTIDLCDSDEEVTSNQEKQTDDQSEPKTTETNVTIKSEPIDLDDNDNDDDETEVPIETQSDSNFDDEIQRLQLVSNEISIGSDDEVQHDDERDSDAHLNDDEDMALQKAVESLNCVENNTGGETNETNLETPDLVEENPTTDATSSQDINSRTDDNDNESSTNENTDNHPSMQTDTNTNEDIDHTLENFSPTDLVVKLEKDAIITDSTKEVLPVISTITSAGVPVDLGDAVEGESLKPENSVNTLDISIKNIDQNMAIQIKHQNQITQLDDDITEVVNPQSIIPHHSKLLHQNDNHESENKKVQARNIEHLGRNKVDNQIENTEQISDDNQTEKREVVETHNKEYSSSEEDIISLMSHNRDDIIKLESPTVKKLDEFDVPMDLDFADDGIQLVDDGIVESDNEQNLESEEKEPKIDLKLLMCPVVYTTKIDNMAIFKYTPITEQIQDKAVIDQIAFLSKPVSKLALLAEIEIQKQEAKKESQKVQIFPATDESLEVSMTDIEHQELIIKREPEETALNEEIATSDDEEVPRIKSTSYLLRKPKNRSYNPIQLCKNPDFNTRLKRIPVSFYTYPRNRILLNECKPMTIDVSKAFESKLYNGTLYLTQTRFDPCGTPLHKAYDDATPTSIVPSAPPVPCLVDVDKILEEELKKRVVERNRAINLPDITEVRRINQQLLTAEVMPLKKSLENEITDIVVNNSAVSINTSVGDNPTDCNSPVALATPTVSDSPVLLASTTVSDIPTVCDNSAVVDNAIIINDDQTPEPEIESQCNRNTEIVDEDTVTPIPYLEPVIPQKNPAKAKPPVKIIDERDKANSNNNDNSLNQARKQFRKNAQLLPNWLTKPTYPVDNSDLLLTTDTLYKMLFAIDPEAIKSSSLNRYVNETLKNDVVFEKQKIFKKKMRITREDDTTQEIQTKRQDAKQKPNPQSSNVKAKVNVVYDKTQSGQKKYCCWARHKLEYIKDVITRHEVRRIRYKHSPCGDICHCCCAEALRNQVAIQNEKVDDYKRMEQEKKYLNLKKHVQEKLQEQEEILKKACESIESVVQKSKERKGEEVGVYTVDSAPVEPLRTLTDDVPVAINKNACVHLEPRDNPDNVVVPETSISINYEKPLPSILQMLSIKTNAQSQAAKLKENTPIKKNIPQKGLKWSTCPCKRPILTQSNNGTILVDGTKSCAIHNKNKKELERSKKGKLYINRKSSCDRPIFIGKNKLLLTNIKKTAQQPLQPTFLSAVPADNDIQMPEGVQIILLPDGTLTYTVDPNSQLTETQLAVMPTILAAIKHQINCGNLSMVPTATVVEDIGLSDFIGFQDAPNNNPNNPVEPSIVETIDLDDDEPNDSIPIASQGPGIDASNDTSLNDDKPSDMSTMQLHSPKANDNIVPGETAQIEEVMEVDNMQTNQSNDDSQTPANETSESSKSKNDPQTEINTAVVPNTENKPSEPSDSKKTSLLDRKSLLSDLMEMSGICEEDVAPAPVPTPIPIDPELHLAKTTIFTTKPRLPAIAPKPSPETCKDIYADLTTVNSFSELKYAYENNGLFFKLDLETGVIVPITLCIKKKGQTAAPSIPESIIDLTNDKDITDDVNVTFNTNSTDVPHNIKTSHVFQRVFDEVKGSDSIRKYPPASKIKNNYRLNIRKKNMPGNSASLSIEIDSDGSGTPMVEEYLDSSSSDESDNEPLAKKAKRAAESRQNSSQIENKLSSLDSTVNIETDGQAALESTINEELMLSESVKQAEMQPGVPKPTHLVLTRDAVHETVPIDTFFQNEVDDSDEEDCILGV